MNQVAFDPGWLQPYVREDGVKCVTINGKKTYNKELKRFEFERWEYPLNALRQMGYDLPVWNSTMLRKEEWLELEKQVLGAAQLRLRAWADLSGANTFGGFDGMSKMVLEHETANDPGEAMVDMEGVADGRNDAPLYQLEGLPLPITYANFHFSARKLRISRGGNTPIDMQMGKAAGRRVAEMVEKTTIGVETGITYGGASTYVGGYGRNSKVYGYLNFPQRLLKNNIATPTGSNPENTVADVLAMRDQLTASKKYGPWMIYHSNDWDKYMDNDYAFVNGSNWATTPSKTLRERLRQIDGVQDVRRLDYLPASATQFSAAPDRITVANPFTLIMVELTDETARAVNGMDLTVVQWETKGGMMLNFKVMCIWVPQLRADFYGHCGILIGTTS
jgi:hypothetical protein